MESPGVTATSPPLSRIPAIGTSEPKGRSTLAAFLSFVFPGLGQAYNGQYRLAWALAAPVFVLIAGLTLVIAVARSNLYSQLLDVPFLVGLIVLDATLLGWRLVAVVQAHLAREPFARRRWTTWLTSAIVVLTVATHVVPAYDAVKTIDTLGSITGGVSRGPHDGWLGGRLPGASTHPEVELGERVNVLLVGIDAAPNRSTQLTDTMLVVSLDPRGGRSAMISIPRDLYGVPLADGRIYDAKLNSLMARASANPGGYPDGGVETLKGAIGELLGVKIHYFAAINLLGFKQAVDSIGGVDVTVERAINDRTYREPGGRLVGFYLEPGRYHMNGTMALAYARSRKGVGDSDFTRADRQQQLLAALREKLTAQNLVLALPGLLDAVKSAVATDIPQNRMRALARAVQDADTSKLRRIVLQPPEYMTADPFSAAGYILIPDLDAIRQVGRRLLRDRPAPTASPPTTSPQESP